jgi:hypothetical protein
MHPDVASQHKSHATHLFREENVPFTPDIEIWGLAVCSEFAIPHIARFRGEEAGALLLAQHVVCIIIVME